MHRVRTWNRELHDERAHLQRLPRRHHQRTGLVHLLRGDLARGRESEAYDRAIDVQISRLRRKLDDSAGELIRTVRSEGYMFTAKVTSGS